MANDNIIKAEELAVVKFEEVRLALDALQKSQEDTKKSVDALLDAVKELTKAVAELTKENIRWFRAGKMGG